MGGSYVSIYRFPLQLTIQAIINHDRKKDMLHIEWRAIDLKTPVDCDKVKRE
jgi:hypothetical protein